MTRGKAPQREDRLRLRPEARVKGWGKSPPRRRQRRRHGKPRQEQCRIGTARASSKDRARGFSRPGGPGWLHEPVGDGGPRGMAVGDSGRHRIRLTGHPRASSPWDVMGRKPIRRPFRARGPVRHNFSGIFRRCCSPEPITRYCVILAASLPRLVSCRSSGRRFAPAKSVVCRQAHTKPLNPMRSHDSKITRRRR